MMRTLYALPLLAAFALAACGGNKAGEGAGEGAADATAEAPTPQPGQYSTTTELLDLDIPGVSKEAVDMMRSQMAEGAAEPHSYCLTAKDAANARQQMLSDMAEGNCTVSRFDVTGGTVDAEMQCRGGNGGPSGTVGMTGTMSATGSDMVMSFDQVVPNTNGAHIRMRVTSERTGECS